MIFLLLILLWGCHHEIDHADLAFEAMNTYAEKVHNEFGFYMTGQGGAMMNDIEEFDIWLDRETSATVDEARQLLIQIGDGFIQQINADEKIRPYLHDYPITPKNVSLHLSFNKSREKPLDDKCVYFAFLLRGKIFYNAYDPSAVDPFDPCIVLGKETYEEAVEKIRNPIGDQGRD